MTDLNHSGHFTGADSTNHATLFRCLGRWTISTYIVAGLLLLGIFAQKAAVAAPQETRNLRIPEEFSHLVTGGDWGPAFTALLADMGDDGGTIQLGANNYKILTTVTIQNQPVRFMGTSSQVSSKGSVLDFGPTASLILNQASNSVFDGVYFLKKDGTGDLIRFQPGSDSGSSYVTFSNCTMVGGGRTVYITDALHIRFLNCRIRGNANTTAVVYLDASFTGVEGHPRVGDNVDAVEMVQCNISASEDTTTLVLMDGGVASTKMTQCALLFGGIGIHATNTGETTRPPKFFYFSDGGFENGHAEVLRLEAGSVWAFTNAYFSHDDQNTALIHLTPGFEGTFRVSNSYLRGAGREHLLAQNADMLQLTGCQIGNGNTSRESGMASVVIGADVSSAALTGNSFGQFEDGGLSRHDDWIRVAPRADNLVAITGNVFRDTKDEAIDGDASDYVATGNAP